MTSACRRISVVGSQFQCSLSEPNRRGFCYMLPCLQRMTMLDADRDAALANTDLLDTLIACAHRLATHAAQHLAHGGGGGGGGGDDERVTSYLYAHVAPPGE
jgi:hypothetical protein